MLQYEVLQIIPCIGIATGYGLDDRGVLVYFERLSWHLPAGTGENNEKNTELVGVSVKIRNERIPNPSCTRCHWF
jgi:hypothetical protein